MKESLKLSRSQGELGQGKVAWSFVFEQISGLRTLIDVVHVVQNILSRIELRICNIDGKYFVWRELGVGVGSGRWELGVGGGRWELGVGVGSGREWELGVGVGRWEWEGSSKVGFGSGNSQEARSLPPNTPHSD